MMSDPMVEIVIFVLDDMEDGTRPLGARAPEWTALSRGDKVQVWFNIGTVMSSKSMHYNDSATQLVLASLGLTSVDQLPRIKTYWRKVEAEWEEDSNEETDGEDGDENDTV